MALDAEIHAALLMPDGRLKLFLAPLGKRRHGATESISLVITNWREEDNPSGLIGVHIHGSSGEVMIGQKLWAERRGYGEIALVPKVDP